MALTAERLVTEERNLARRRELLADKVAELENDEAAHAERVYEFALATLKKTGVTAADLPAFAKRLRGLIDDRDKEGGAVSPAPASKETAPAAPRPTAANAAVHLVIRKGRNQAKAGELNKAGWRWHGKHGGYWHCHADPAELDRRIADARHTFGDDVVVEMDPPRQAAATATKDDGPGRAEDATPAADADRSPEASEA